MTYECFDVEIADQVAHIRLKRGDELNTMNRAFWRELPEIVDGIDEQASARAIVVSSTGKHFSAGMDLSVFMDPQPSTAAPVGSPVSRGTGKLNVAVLQDSFTCFERARMPVIAAVQGGVIGGAIDMISACDFRYASADAFFQIMEINIGMTADVGTLQRLPKIIPEGVAREYAYTGRRMSAARALEVGLVNQVFDTHEAAVEAALEAGREIASKPPLAIWGTKEMINFTRDHSVADSLNYIATWQSGMFSPEDMAEAFAARAEKRDGKYPDLEPRPTGL
jgi:enoyl-CoA hydratase